MESAPTPQPGPPATPAPTGPATIQYDDFAKLDLRVATILDCVAHPNADKLLVLQLDVNGEKRQICAGLRQHIADPKTMVGKQIVIVANLAPRQMRGQISQGMLLAATDPASRKVIVITPSEPVASGSKVS
ncbi:MAG: methionine--tRNA ligase subunit beta [Tepidisphaeraceae bacterium]|jgi:methionyl-tRNA synthetase